MESANKNSLETKNNKENKTYLTVKVLSILRDAQLSHGLRHNDYQLYRQYCTRKLRRLRDSLGLIQGDKKNFHKKNVTINNCKEERSLYIPLVSIERCWAYAMQLKEESIQDPRKKFSMRNKLRKARKYAQSFEQLVEQSDLCDARTHLEVQGYCAWLQGTVLFEIAESNNNWEEPVQYFNKAVVIYSKLGHTVSDEEAEIYTHKLQELEVKLRYCRHHLGDKAATDTLLAMRGNEDLGEKLERLVAIARENQARTLSEVTWKGRTLSVKHEKVRLFLLNEGLIHEELNKISDPERRADLIDKLLMDCKDAIQIIREELTSDSTFKARQQAGKGPTTPLHFLYTYLSYIKLRLTNIRNWSLHHQYVEILNGERKVEQNKKAPKLQDILRLCEIIIQNLLEMTQLSGLEEDLELKQEVQNLNLFYRAYRDFYAAESYFAMEKWGEALAIYARSNEYAINARKYKFEDFMTTDLENLILNLEKKKCITQAKVFAHAKSPKPTQHKNVIISNKLLVDRLDEYVEDFSLINGSPNVACVPPQMVVVPCKPLFFDLALNHIDFPDLQTKQSKPDSPTKQPGGIRGLVKGLWGWAS